MTLKVTLRWLGWNFNGTTDGLPRHYGSIEIKEVVFFSLASVTRSRAQLLCVMGLTQTHASRNRRQNGTWCFYLQRTWPGIAWIAASLIIHATRVTRLCRCPRARTRNGSRQRAQRTQKSAIDRRQSWWIIRARLRITNVLIASFVAYTNHRLSAPYYLHLLVVSWTNGVSYPVSLKLFGQTKAQSAGRQAQVLGDA